MPSDITRARSPRACALAAIGDSGVAVKVWWDPARHACACNCVGRVKLDAWGEIAWLSARALFMEHVSNESLLGRTFAEFWGYRGEQAPGLSGPTANFNTPYLFSAPQKPPPPGSRL